MITFVVLGLTDPWQVERLHKTVLKMTGPSALSKTWMFPMGDGPVRSKVQRRAQRRQSATDELLTRVVGNRRSGDPSGDTDVLGLLLRQERALGIRTHDTEMNEELLALLLAGYETTAAALGWAIERLTREPLALTQLTESLREGDSTYLRAFIREVLRWRPPVVDAVRELTQPMNLAGYRIPEGALVVVVPLLVHSRDDACPSPDAFQPNRFLDDPRPGKGWIAFGGGRRHCLGSELAMLQMEIVITQMMNGVTFSPSKLRPEQARLLGTVMVPSRGSIAVISRPGPLA